MLRFSHVKKEFRIFFSLNDIADLLLDRCVSDNNLRNEKRVYVKDGIMLKKHHLFEKSTVANNLLHSTTTREKSLIKSMSDHTFFQTSSKISKFNQIIWDGGKLMHTVTENECRTLANFTVK